MGKVKRYRSIYSNRRRNTKSPLVVMLLVIGACLLVFIGYSIAGPIGDFISGKLAVSGPSSSAASSAVSQAAGSAASSAVSSTVSSTVSSEPSSGISSGSSQIVGIYLPKSYLSNSSSLENVISKAKSAGVNFAVVDLKAEDGKLNYASSIALAKKYKLTVSNAPDAGSVAKKLTESGITPCARICAFEDHTTPRLVRRLSIIYSKNHSYRWLDGNKNYWMNPYSDDAQQYIIDVAKEAISMGYEYIMLDGVVFPTGNYQYFGGSTVSREDTLKNFVSLATQKINAAGGKVILHVTAGATVGKASTLTGQNQDIYGYGADYVDAECTPSSFTSTLSLDGEKVTSPASHPGKTVLAIGKYLAGLADTSKFSTTVATVQANGYSSSQINDEISSLKEAGISSYILKSSNGSYDFSGVNLS